MKLTRLHIKNFRSCCDVPIEIGNMHALVGANNAGKSSVLRALDFLFNPSAKMLNEESFWNKDTSLEIRVEAIFSELTNKEKEALGAYHNTDGTFHMACSAKMGASSGESESESDSEQDEDKIGIGQHCKKPVPQTEWLQESNIDGNNIKEWWKKKEQLAVNDVSFADFLGETKEPKVNVWKEKAKEFISTHADKIPMRDAWIDNPKGYANVPQRHTALLRPCPSRSRRYRRIQRNQEQPLREAPLCDSRHGQAREKSQDRRNT